jgi:hypothetical protein
MEVLLISTQFLKDNSVIDSNIDDKIIANTIMFVQESKIQEILGTNLLNKLTADAGSGTLTGLYKTLVDDYVRWTLLYYTVAELLEPLQFRITNKGIVTKDSESRSTSVSSELLYKLKDSYLQKAEYYSEKTQKFLLKNYNSLPELVNIDITDVRPFKDRNTAGVLLYNGKNKYYDIHN